MRFFRTFLALIFILIIVGGLGYIGWSTLIIPMNDTEMNKSTSTHTPKEQTPDQQSNNKYTIGSSAPLNITAIHNRDALNHAIGTIKQAIDLITIDPYSKTTLPQTNSSIQSGSLYGQIDQGNGTINIYPSGNSSVTVEPNGVKQTPPVNIPQGNVSNDQNKYYVFDQGKLEQLHKGVFSLAQGIMIMNQLNDELLVQSKMVEATPANDQTYIIRYNTALENKTKLTNAFNLLNQGTTLINVNPYAPPNGYPYDKEAMTKLHEGIYKLAEGMARLNNLNEDFATQMGQASKMVQNNENTFSQTSHGISNLDGLFTDIPTSTLLNIIVIVLIVGFITGVLGAIMSMLRKTTEGKLE